MGRFERYGRNIDTGINAIGDSASNMAKNFKEGVQSVRESGRNIANRARNTYNRAERWANNQVAEGLKTLEGNWNNFSSSVRREGKLAIEKAGAGAKTLGNIIAGAAQALGSSVKNISINAGKSIVTFTLATGQAISINIINPTIRNVKDGAELVKTYYYISLGVGKVIGENISRLEKSISSRALRELNSIKIEMLKLGKAGGLLYNSCLLAIANSGRAALNTIKGINAAYSQFKAGISTFVYNKAKNALEIGLRNGKKLIIKVGILASESITSIKNKLKYYERIGKGEIIIS